MISYTILTLCTKYNISFIFSKLLSLFLIYYRNFQPFYILFCIFVTNENKNFLSSCLCDIIKSYFFASICTLGLFLNFLRPHKGTGTALYTSPPIASPGYKRIVVVIFSIIRLIIFLLC